MSENWKLYENNEKRLLTDFILDPLFSFTINELRKDISEEVISLLDIGAGEGIFYDDWIYRHEEMYNKIEYTGIDINKALFRRRLISFLYPKLCLKVADAQKELPFDDESFDIAISKMVLHNLSDLDTHFLEVSRILKPGGKYLMAVLSNEYIADKIGRFPQQGEIFDYHLGKANTRFRYCYHNRQNRIYWAEKHGLYDMKFECDLSLQGNSKVIEEIAREYPRALKVKPFDLLMVNKDK